MGRVRPRKQKNPSRSTPPASGDGKDRISNLPEDVLRHILSFLTTEEACRTSILSKQWESLWNTLPDVSFHCFSLSPQLYTHRYASFVRFVNKVLGPRKPPHAGPGIRKFKLFFVALPYFPPHHFNTWIHHAIKCHAQVLDILVRFILPPRDNNIDLFPLSLLTSENVTTLKLHGNLSFDPSSSPWLPSLKVLDLSLDYEYCDKLVPSLLSGCPALEEFRLSGTYHVMEIRAPKLSTLCAKLQCRWMETTRLEIDAPSLVHLSLCDSNPVNYVIKNLDNVMEARLSIEVYRRNGRCLFDLLRGISNVKSLHLSLVIKESALDWLYDEEDYSTGNLSDPHHHSLPEFPNLVRLHFDESSHLHLLPSFAQKSPKLEVLVIKRRCHANASRTKPQGVPRCLSSSLTHFTYRGFLAKKEEFETIEYIFRNSSMLRTLTIQPALLLMTSKPRNEISRICQELATLRRGSRSGDWKRSF